MRPIDADALIKDVDGDLLDSIAEARAIEKIENAPTIGGWINNYEWICPACGTSILVKTSRQSKAIGMKLSVCPVCGKEILYGKAD